MMGRVPYVPGGRVYRSGESYPPVQVPENRSSIPGLVDKTDPGWLPTVVTLALCLLADCAVVAAIYWWLQ